jgi:dTDP-glucose pyrophosphorylase/CBS domain-containing protein
MENLIISKSKTIKSALKQIKKTGHKCLIVTSGSNKLLGSISDGDIRNALINNASIYEKIDKYFQKNSKFLIKGNFSHDQAKSIFLNHNYGLVPIIDNKKKIVDILYRSKIIDEKINKLNVPVIIMAGGKGTRLKPLTHVLPKPLIPIRNKPIIDYIINHFRKYGAKEFYLTLNYKSKILEAYFNESEEKIKYVTENSPLGTAGILYKFRNKKKNFFISNCDTLIDIDLSDFYEFHKKNKNDFTIVVSSKEINIPYGICNINNDGELIKISEKPSYDYLISVGLYLINSRAFKLIPGYKYFNMNQLISLSIKKKLKVKIYPINFDSWQDVGKWDNLQKIIK